jgi:hypothetical protein
MSETLIRISTKEWNLFVWQRDECERIQGKACVGCGFTKDCISLYQKVGELYKSNIVASQEHENQQPSKGNACVENHGEDIEVVYKRVHRNLRVTRKNGKVVA